MVAGQSAPGSISVDGAAMAHSHHQDNQSLILQLADDPIIAHAIAPQAESASAQWLSKLTRILRGCYALIHVIEDLALDGTIQLLEVAQRLGIVFNGPVHCAGSAGKPELLANLTARERRAAFSYARLGKIAIFQIFQIAFDQFSHERAPRPARALRKSFQALLNVRI